MARSLSGKSSAKVERPGRSLERLVAALERSLAGTGATVEAPSRRLRDRDTGRVREYDVLILWDHAHHQIITAVECRDRSRPIGVPAVEAFAKKCERTGVHHCVMVSSTGFAASARVKAEATSITCMDIEQVDGFDWLATNAFIETRRNFEPINAHLIFAGEKVPKEPFVLFDGEGAEVSVDAITQTIMQNVPSEDRGAFHADAERRGTLHLNTPGWYAIDAQDARVELSHILSQPRFTTTVRAAPFETLNYRGGGKDYSVASTSLELGPIKARLMMVKKDDGEIGVVLVRE